MTESTLFCGGCGYDLQRLTSDRCPECGLIVAANGGGTIPWERRSDLGYVRSFLMTVSLATFRPSKLAVAATSRVDVRSARLFRRWTVFLAWLPVMSLSLLILFTASGTDVRKSMGYPDISPGGPNMKWEPALMWLAGVSTYPTLPIGMLLTLLMGTGIAHWFYVPGLPLIRQNRAMAISYYLCGPLVYLFVPTGAFAIVVRLTANDDSLTAGMRNIVTIAGTIVSVFGSLILIVLAINPLRVLQKTTHTGMGRLLFAGPGMLIQAAISIVVGVGLFPAVVGLLWLMIDSLRK